MTVTDDGGRDGVHRRVGRHSARAQQALDLQRSQIRARTGAQSSQQSVIVQRSRQLSEQRQGYLAQQRSFQEQQRILEDQLEGLREIEERGFASKTRIRELERAQEEMTRDYERDEER